ncbi:MAG TPA: sigma-70 family RNA polymerase sigma factor [Kofleriaceae bacterium]|jgi:RNA polymerase sigma factor for flagellar operon FliA
MAGADRAKLLTDHTDLVHRVANVLYPRVRKYLDHEELVSMGTVGLAEAAAAYDPAKGASFKTFAWYRIHGAMIDGVRALTNLPRGAWVKLQALRATADYLELQGERARSPAVQAMGEPSRAQALGDVANALAAIQTMFTVSLDAAPDPADAAESAPEAMDRRRFAAALDEAIHALPEKEQRLVVGYYREGKSFVELAAELGLSKSWVSRVHAQAIDRLKRALAPP